MEIVRLEPTSLIDYPGQVAAVGFVAGCNFRCPFCHNPQLVLPEKALRSPPLPEGDVLRCLAERRGFLDGLVITGGEPALQPGLERFVREVKALGLLVKLDTNGSRPDVLERLLDAGLLDYVAMDVKAPFARYAEFAGACVDLSAMERSIRLVRERAPDYEFRTTVAPGLRLDDLDALADRLGGARRWFLQHFVVPPTKELVDPAWGAMAALSRQELEAAWETLRDEVLEGGVR